MNYRSLTFAAAALAALLGVSACSSGSTGGSPVALAPTATVTALSTVTVVSTVVPTPSISVIQKPPVTVTMPPRTLPVKTVTRTQSPATIVRQPAPTTRTAAQAPAGNSAVWAGHPNRVGGAPEPAFPSTLPNWQLSTSWDTTDRAFDTNWSPISGPSGNPFPSTMTGCEDQRFVIRWRAEDPTAQIDVRWSDDANDPGPSVVTSNAGWFDLDSCEHPEIHFNSGANGSTLADVDTSVQVYTHIG